MKKRFISGIVFALVFIVSFFLNSKIFALIILGCSLICFNELSFNKCREKKTIFIKCLSYLMLGILVLNKIFFEIPTSIWGTLLIITFLTPIVFYNDSNKYNVNDALYYAGIIMLIGVSFNTIAYLKDIDIWKCIFIFLVATITDTYAYIGGSLIGRHKLTTISPKKTWEGSIIGSIIGTIIASVFYYNLVGNISIFEVIILSFSLTILSEVGDLVFSSIKRLYNVKDYSNLIPGHGGLLDRFDSILFVALGMALIISVI